jgi:hypothetical protein
MTVAKIFLRQHSRKRCDHYSLRRMRWPSARVRNVRLADKLNVRQSGDGAARLGQALHEGVRDWHHRRVVAGHAGSRVRPALPSHRGRRVREGWRPLARPCRLPDRAGLPPPMRMRRQGRADDRAGGTTAVAPRCLVEAWPEWEPRAGSLCAIFTDHERGMRTGGADPRRLTYTIGW